MATTGRDAGGGVGQNGDSGSVGVGGEKRRRKVELLQEAIHGLLEENRVKHQQQHGEEEGSMVTRDQEEDLILSSLLSKLNALEKEVDLDNAELNTSHQDSESRMQAGQGDVLKDLNKIKRQNMITHILLGTVIVVTAAWQFKELSFLLAVQKKLTNPFKSLGDMVNGALKRGRKSMIEASIPDVTQTDLSTLAIGNSDGS